MTQTGANADEWIPVKPGTEGVLALGLANVILANKLRPRPADAPARDRRMGSGLADYAPARVEEKTGVSAKRVEQLARDLADQAPSVAFAGGPALAHTNGAVHGACGQCVERTARQRSVSRAASSLRRPRGRVAIGDRRVAAAAGVAAKVVLLDGANPVYGAPKAGKVREALDRTAFIVELRQLHRRHKRARRSHPAGSLFSGVVGRCRAGVGCDRCGVDIGRTGDEAAVSDARDRRRADRRGRQTEVADRAPVEDVRRDAEGALEAARRWSAAQTQGGWWGECRAPHGTARRAQVRR